MSTAENRNPQDEPEKTENAVNEEQEAGTTQPEKEQDAKAQDPITALQAERDEMRDKMLRAMAEAENVRKRAERTQADTSKYAVAGFARDMLDIADNLRRAIDAVPESERQSEAIKNLMDGVEATERVMLSTFEKYGIKKIAPTEGRFDPNFHEVMFEAEAAGKQAGEIIQLLEAGYVIHDRLLRPARVGVAKSSGGNPKEHSLDQEV